MSGPTGLWGGYAPLICMKRIIHRGMCVNASSLWFFYRLSHDSQLVIDSDLSTAYNTAGLHQAIVSIY